MSDFLQIKNDTDLPLRDVVFQTIRRAIIMGKILPGERLMEEHLAERMGVSRTPIREAMRMLELEGLVTMVPRCGARVSKISISGLEDVLEVRGALDELAIKLACDRIDKEELDNLKKAMESFEESIETGDVIKIAEADVRFHDIIVKATKNVRLAVLVQNLSEQVYRYRYEYVKDVSMHGELIREHRNMYESILNKDKDSAVKAVEQHIRRQEQVIIRNLHLEDSEQ